MKIKSLIKTVLVYTILLYTFFVHAQNIETWVDNSNNTKLLLSSDGMYQLSNSTAVTQGSYSVQNNILMMQDNMGNYYQYGVQSYTVEQMVLVDENGVSYTYTQSKPVNNQVSQHTNQHVTTKFPWDLAQYNQILSEKNGYQWKERENQIYVEFLQLLIGQKVSVVEVNSIRQDFVNEFNDNPLASMNEIKQIQTAMSQVYSLNNIQAVAMAREQMAAEFYKIVQQQPEMNKYAFVQILNRYIKILSIDNSTNLSLSNQDVDGYINYLQFQAMLMGQSYQLTQQDRMTMQIWLSNEFNNYAAEQKQTLAFAGFIWSNLVQQWSSMNIQQQQQYISQIQSLMNVQNVKVNLQTADNFWNNSNQNNYGSYDSIDYSAQANIDYSDRMRETDNMIFTAIQNNMTENHVMMMNMLNTDSDYEYVVDYGTDY